MFCPICRQYSPRRPTESCVTVVVISTNTYRGLSHQSRSRVIAVNPCPLRRRDIEHPQIIEIHCGPEIISSEHIDSSIQCPEATSPPARWLIIVVIHFVGN